MTDPNPEGTTLSGGHYRLGPPLTAAVRAARDEWGERDVVAVALDGASPDALPRVARDIRRASAHPHPGLAPATDVAADADRGLWLVHDLPAGVRGLTADGPVPAGVALRRALVLAEALGAAHAARLVHGRIGADVVVVGDDGVRLLGAASGVRPPDRPAAEDDDTRALASVLRQAAVDESDPELAGRLTAVLDRAARDVPEVTGELGATLRSELRGLAGRRGADPPPEEPSIRLTEVVPTATATGAWSPTVPVGVDAAVRSAGGGARERPTARILVPPAAPGAEGPGPAAPASSFDPRSGPGVPPRGAPFPTVAVPSGPHGPPPHRPGPREPGGAPPRRTGLVALAVAVVGVLVAGAVAAVLVLRADEAPAGPVDRVVPAAIGDPRTVDPCGLVDPAALATRTGGEARIVPDLGSPAGCVVDVAAPGGDVAVIATLEPVATGVSAAREERVGALLVRRPAPQDGSCTRTVVTTDGVQVSLDAVAPAGSAADPCVAADTATDSTLRVLQQGTVLPRRAVTDPPSALTSVDTCALLTAPDLDAVAGLDPARVAPGVGGWSCRWGVGASTGTSTGTSTAVEVGVERRRSFAPTTDLAGRQAAITPRQGACDATLAQRVATAADGSPRVEVLEVTVFGTRSADALCADAARLAGTTVPRLPAP